MFFSAGFEIRRSHFVKALKPGALVGITGVISSLLLGFFASYAVVANFELSVYLGTALSATSIGLTIPLLAQEELLISQVWTNSACCRNSR